MNSHGVSITRFLCYTDSDYASEEMIRDVVSPAVCKKWGWSGGEMVLGELSVPGRPTDLDYSSARAYCACSNCRWGLL